MISRVILVLLTEILMIESMDIVIIFGSDDGCLLTLTISIVVKSRSCWYLWVAYVSNLSFFPQYFWIETIKAPLLWRFWNGCTILLLFDWIYFVHFVEYSILSEVEESCLFFGDFMINRPIYFVWYSIPFNIFTLHFMGRM